ncbi:MAG: hypothetical protein ABIN91_10445 [Mucilaginibacter sp.]|uniref:hypothetical protein n=1 Tax=Mucilaginibacter sp. TaxID=1882438 RepID=UPI0032649F8D
MKRYLLFPLLILASNWANAQSLTFVKCVSGDCQNGIGVAEFMAAKNDPISGTVLYIGNFKEGKLSGEGTISNDSYIYSGSFDNNYYSGYGTKFQTKKVRDVNVPDSTGWVDFYRWDEDGCYIGMTLQRDNEKVAQHHGYNKKHTKFRDKSAFDDEWIMQHLKALIASGARGHVIQYETNIIAQKIISARRGQPSKLITWDCLADRQYYVTASAWENGKFAQMPFGGYVNYQVTAEDGSVVFEGRADRYWTPIKDGKYSFTVKFDQAEISGNGNLYVEGVNLTCSLRSRRAF